MTNEHEIELEIENTDHHNETQINFHDNQNNLKSNSHTNLINQNQINDDDFEPIDQETLKQKHERDEKRLNDKENQFLFTNGDNFPKSIPCCCSHEKQFGGLSYQLYLSLGIAILFIAFHSAFTLRWIIEETHWVFVFPTIIIAPLLIIIMLRAGHANPGIVPRRVYGIGKNPPFVDSNALTVTLENGKEITLYHCRSCFFKKPPKTVHCRQCNNCVEEFDHHCPWLGNCIGRNNYRLFMTFLLIANIYLLYIFISSVLATFLMIERPYSAEHAKEGLGKHFYLEPIIAVCSLPFLYFVLHLLIMHISQISKGITTNEKIKEPEVTFSKGWKQNWLRFLFRSNPPAYTWQYYIKNGDKRCTIQRERSDFSTL